MVRSSYSFRLRGILTAMLANMMAASLLLSGCGSSQVGEAGSTSRAIQNKGSDTIVNLALAWAEAYQKVDPSVSIAVTGGGSGTGIAALVNNTVDIANASRKIKDDEITAAQKNGVNPVEFVIAVDALAVIVNPSNPVSQLTIAQLADIFTGRITNWRDVGGRDAPIILVSRESNSGTHVYFLEQVVRRGDPKNKDIFAAQGHVLDTIELNEPNVKYLQPPLLLRNVAGRFTEVNPGAGGAFGQRWAGRGAAFGDLDNDGDTDVVVSNCGQNAYILSNTTGNRNHWLRVELKGTKSNRRGIGARITARAGSTRQTYEVQTSASYLAASDHRVLIGLGKEDTVAELEVRWPSGTVEVLRNLKANQAVVVEEAK